MEVREDTGKVNNYCWYWKPALSRRDSNYKVYEIWNISREPATILGSFLLSMNSHPLVLASDFWFEEIQKLKEELSSKH